MQYDQEHREGLGLRDRALGPLKRKPDVSGTTHSGDPKTVHLPPVPTPTEATPVSTEATGAIKLEKVDGAAPDAPVMNPDKPKTDAAKPDDKKPDDTTAKPDDKKKKKKKTGKELTTDYAESEFIRAICG